MSSPAAHLDHDEEEFDDAPRRPIPRRWWVIGVLGIGAMIALVTWFGLSASVGRVTYQTSSYAVRDNTAVEVAYGVQRPANTAVDCTIKAMDARYGAVGLLDVHIPAGPETNVVRADTVRTVALAVTGVVDTCRPA